MPVYPGALHSLIHPGDPPIQIAEVRRESWVVGEEIATVARRSVTTLCSVRRSSELSGPALVNTATLSATVLSTLSLATIRHRNGDSSEVRAPQQRREPAAKPLEGATPCGFKAKLGDVVQLVRTLPCHGRGRGFEPRRPRHTFQKIYGTYGPKVTPKSGFDMGAIRNLPPILRGFFILHFTQIWNHHLHNLACAARLFVLNACV